jgi:hypothetical protein
MPLGEGYSVEEQLTGQAEFGGLQIEVFPMRAEVFDKRFPIVASRNRAGHFRDQVLCRQESCAVAGADMGLAPGGRMRQEIFADPYSIYDWDTEHSSRCFIHLVNSATWQAITGQRPPSRPPSAGQYTIAGYPWFDYYDAEMKALDGSKTLAGVKSVKTKAEEKRAEPLRENDSVSVTNVVSLRAGLRPGQVRETDFSA